jgi:hypothetical protein
MPTTDTASLIVSCKTQGQANLDRINQSLTGMDGFAKRAIGTFAGFFAGAKIFQFGKHAVGAFQETQDAAWKFSQTFSTIQGTAENTFRNFQQTYGLAESSARKMIGDTGDLLTGLGFSQEMALKFGDAASRLGTDLAGYTNYAGGAAGATSAIVSALTGENERAKALGIVIRQDTEEWKKLVQTFKGSGFSETGLKEFFGDFKSEDKKVMEQWEYMTSLFKDGKNMSIQQANAMAALALSIKQSKNAVGDWIKEGESFSQTMMNQKELAKELSSQVGGMIYQSTGLNKAMTGFNDLMKKSIEYLKKEGRFWSFAFQTAFIDIGSAAMIFYRLSFEPMVNGIVAGFKNIIAIGEWANKNWAKIFDGMSKTETNFLYGFGKDIVQFGKDWAVWTGKSFAAAAEDMYNALGINRLIYGENLYYWANASAQQGYKTVGNFFRETERALDAAGVGKMPELAKADYSGWTNPAKVVDEILKQNRIAQENLKKKFEDSLPKFKKDTKNNAEEATSALEQFNKTLTKIRKTATDAVYAGSVESVRLQNRVFSLASGAGVSQVAKGQEAQKTAESSVKTAEHTKKMVALLEKIAAKPAIATSTVG